MYAVHSDNRPERHPGKSWHTGFALKVISLLVLVMTLGCERSRPPKSGGPYQDTSDSDLVHKFVVSIQDRVESTSTACEKEISHRRRHIKVAIDAEIKALLDYAVGPKGIREGGMHIGVLAMALDELSKALDSNSPLPVMRIEREKGNSRMWYLTRNDRRIYGPVPP